MSRIQSVAVGLVLSTMLLLAACSASNEPSILNSTAPPNAQSSSSTAAETSEPALPSFDAPKEFDGEPVPITLRAINANMAGDFTSRFTLAGDKAYGVTHSGIGAVDLRTGKTLWETKFPSGPGEDPTQYVYDSRGPGAPVISEDGATVYGVLMVKLPASGTTVGSYAQELIAVDAETGDLVWSADIPEGPDVSGTNDESVQIVGELDGRVIVTRPGFSGVTDGTTGAVDTTTHEVLWSAPGTAYAIANDAVIATAMVERTNAASYPQLVGLDPATGDVKWTGGDDQDSAVLALSTLQTPNNFFITVEPYSGADRYTGSLDPSTGTITNVLQGFTLYNPTIDGDTVYDVSTQGDLRALDPTTLDVVWELPQGDRIAPESPVFFGGLVYGKVSDGMSVVLDGKTGTDVTIDIPGTFVAVNEHGAIMLRDNEVVFVPATG